MGILDRLGRRLDVLGDALLPERTREALEGARLQIERGRPQSAIAALDAVLAERPGLAAALALRGAALLAAGDPASAARSFAEALVARPGDAEALLGQGEALLALGEDARAREALRAAAAHGRPAVAADALRGLGRLAARAGDHPRAALALRKALTLDPDDEQAAAELAEILLAADHTPPGALAPLVRLATPETAAPTLVALVGRALARHGDARAEGFLARALDAELPDRPRALALAAHARLRAPRALEAARAAVRQATALLPDDDGIAALDAELARRAGDTAAALRAEVRAAAVAPARADAARAACLTAGEPALAAALGADGLGLVVAAELALHAGDAGAAAGHLALAPDGPHRARARARLALARGDLPLALEESARTLAALPGDPGARLVREQARRRLLAPVGGDTRADAARFHAATVALPELAALAGPAARLVASFDQPLLVAVAGEFSTGKSTFINAFLGAAIAPVGVTPTTARPNLLAYGAERRARIVRKDDSVLEIPFAAAAAVLTGLDAEGLGAVDRVEILLPSDTLAHVNIADTPGLNAPEPEHERTTRAFLERADAVVWLFSATQAGKATERLALEALGGRRVLAVLNKADVLAPAERDALLARLRAELGGLVEEVVPVSARGALEARLAGDEAALAASGWPAVAAALEARFFSQARALKAAACGRVFVALLDEAAAALAARANLDAALAARLLVAAAAQGAARRRLEDELVPAERDLVDTAVAHAYRDAAAEVLALHDPAQADAADRDHIAAYLGRRLDAALADCRRRAGDLLEGAADAAEAAADAADPHAAAELRAHADDGWALVDAGAFAWARAYASGYLAGDRLDGFFLRELPRLNLRLDDVAHALFRDAPELGPLLAARLAALGARVLDGLAARLAALGDAAGDRAAGDRAAAAGIADLRAALVARR